VTLTIFRFVARALCLTAGLLLVAPRAAGAAGLETGPLPDALWWSGAEALPLSHDPLGVLSPAPRIRIEQEWAPLYSDRGGARIDRAHRTLTARSRVPSLGTAAVIETRALVARTAAGNWGFGAEHPSGERAFAVIGFEGPRGEVAAALGASEWRPGAALAGRAMLAPGWYAGATWSRWTIGGSMDVRWNDERVHAAARWTEQRAGWRISWEPTSAFGVTLEQLAIDGDPAAFEAPDRASPETAWRATRLAVGGSARAAPWRAEAAVGEGREGLRLWRGGAAYGLVSGPVRRADVSVEVEPTPWRLRAWSGRWRGEARGAVALWAFDGLAGAAGSRRVATSDAALDHAGFSVERFLGAREAHTGGLALAWLAPRTSWESWLAPVLGLGRSDETSGETDVRDALALGAKVATRITLGEMLLRAELIQWAPLWMREQPRAAASGPPATPGGGGGAGGSEARGGTIVRLTFEGVR
jgi:hypothetical protein